MYVYTHIYINIYLSMCIYSQLWEYRHYILTSHAWPDTTMQELVPHSLTWRHLLPSPLADYS